MYSRSEQISITTQLKSLWDSYGVDSSKMNFAGILQMLDSYNIPAVRVSDILYVVAKTVVGINTEGDKRKPIMIDFTDAISALQFNKYDKYEAAKALLGR